MKREAAKNNVVKTIFFLLFFLKEKKEVIHPQVPLQIPCDDLAHLTDL